LDGWGFDMVMPAHILNPQRVKILAEITNLERERYRVQAQFMEEASERQNLMAEELRERERDWELEMREQMRLDNLEEQLRAEQFRAKQLRAAQLRAEMRKREQLTPEMLPKQERAQIIKMPPYINLGKIFRVFFTPKYYERVIEQTILGCQDDYFKALKKGNAWNYWWVQFRGYFIVWYAALTQKFFSLLERVIKPT